MEEDAEPLLIPVGNDETDVGILNIQFSPEDLKWKSREVMSDPSHRNPTDNIPPDLPVLRHPPEPFHVEPTNIVGASDDSQRVSDEASAMNKRIHYYRRLTSPSDRRLAAPDHVVPAPEEIYVYSPLGTALKIDGFSEGHEKNSSTVTIFMIWNTMMGTSILSIPWGIKQAGFTTGISIIMLMSILTLYCCYRVLKSRTMIHYFHDINVTDIVPGTNGSNRVICPGDGGPNITGNKTFMFASNSSTGFETFEEWWNKSETVPIYLSVILLLLNFRSPSFFAKFNILGTISLIYLIILVTTKAVLLGFHLEFNWSNTSDYFVPEFRILFPQLTGVLTLAFFIHNCVITLLKNNKNQENNVRDLSIAYLLVSLTYLYVGVLIFAAFPSPPLSKECIEQMVTVYPLLGYLARVQLFGHVFGNVYPSALGKISGNRFCPCLILGVVA
ncbi:Sodium-coupled neutral amino acid transporter 9 [Varanus komodoensis]|nr:Sodium-coupled neutral amino acid transporter 9 [Varanus komodoensis]